MKNKPPIKRSVHVEHSAGGIVFRKLKRVHAERAGSPAQRGGTLSVPICPAQRGGIEIAFILDSYKKWTFPKGRIEYRENIERAAIREVHEELGLTRVRAVRRIGRIDIWFVDRYEHKGVLIHKYIYYVLLQAPWDAKLKKPPRMKRGEIIRAVRWVPMEQALKFSGYKDTEPVLKKAIDILRRVC